MPALLKEKLSVGPFDVLRLLGEGGMGKAYLARHRESGLEAVVKVLHPQLAGNPRARQAFLREIETLTGFRHAHVVSVLGASPQSDENLYLVMEYVPGVSLAALVQEQGRLNPMRVGRIAGQICSVLHAAHHAGILHRDLTASNVLLTDAGSPNEAVKVMDFGLARPGGDAPYVPMEKLSSIEGNVGPGTPDYVSPEQLRGESVDHRADLYSLGVLLFKLLTGRLPFENAKELRDILQAHKKWPVPRFATMGILDIPPALDNLIHDCLAKHPEERPQTARDLAHRFQTALGARILADDAFPKLEKAQSTQGRDFDPGDILDCLEAWMPEAIAAMKLRGFIQAVGGEVVESVPGLIGVRIVDPRTTEAPAGGFLSFLGFGRKALPCKYLDLQLHLKKKERDRRSLVEITVTLPDDDSASETEKAMRRGFGERLCRELRAYLMIG